MGTLSICSNNKLFQINLALSFGNKLDLEIWSTWVKLVSAEHTCIGAEASYTDPCKGTVQSFGCHAAEG